MANQASFPRTFSRLALEPVLAARTPKRMQLCQKPRDEIPGPAGYLLGKTGGDRARAPHFCGPYASSLCRIFAAARRFRNRLHGSVASASVRIVGARPVSPSGNSFDPGPSFCVCCVPHLLRRSLGSNARQGAIGPAYSTRGWQARRLSSGAAALFRCLGVRNRSDCAVAVDFVVFFLAGIRSARWRRKSAIDQLAHPRAGLDRGRADAALGWLVCDLHYSSPGLPGTARPPRRNRGDL